MLRKLATVLAYLLLPAAAFLAGYRVTDRIFRNEVIPYPFESYGLAVGGACFFWTLALLSLFVRFPKNRGGA